MSDPLIITLGCRLNAFESEVMRRHATDAGLSDCVIVNTCAVTGEAVRQASQAIRKARRERPGARIIVTGCAAQIEPERFAEMDGVDHVIGNAEKMQGATYQALKVGSLSEVVVGDIGRLTESAAHMLAGFGSRVRAFLEIQNGCDHRCTFCIIPYGRGPSRSVPAGAVVAEVRELVEAGVQEVVLTGVDITSYGADLPDEASLGRLVKQILRHVPELPRLRLSSIDQVEADDELRDAIAGESRLMPHLHLSLQAGDDMILKRMKRRHCRDDAIRFCSEARRLRPDIIFGADLIAGFPTETEEMFQRSLDLIEECGLTFLHVFPFSPRKGTPAARMPQLDRGAIKERAARLREKGEAVQRRYLEAQSGAETLVLVEREGLGRTPQFAEVTVDGPAAVGALARVHIEGRDGARLIGRVPA